MATEDRFEDVDWDAIGGAGVSRRELAFLGTLLGLAGLAVYDYVVIANQFTTIPALVLPGVGTVFGGYDVSAVDWLSMLTLVVGFYFVVLPLYDNPRLTKYYWRRFRRNRVAVLSSVYLAVIFVVGTFGPAIAGNPELNIIAQYQPPVYTSVSMDVPLDCVGEIASGRCYGSWEYPLGTTSEGQGILKLIILGMRVSMQVGLITMFIVITVGSLVGTTAAYFGGWVDELLMRYVDIQATFPAFFLFLILAYLFTPSLFLLIVLFGFFGWEGVGRLVRSEALQRSEEEYIRAAENAGASDGWIIRRHLLPNVSSTVITAATLLIPSFILVEAAFAFLGLTDPSIPSWGRTITGGKDDLSAAWWIATIPGIFLFFTVLSFNFVGDALRDALDPRSEGET
ncbi:ABC transporter permease [Halomarina litorea]|uniref:ABC transporter permease n=1 Tax=Halomarina litorea TaxID=2961595 RepID=UPI0020C564C1|nr:ABC transporter permease [Halomarina sp. BCD28]